jgi:MFS family permease
VAALPFVAWFNDRFGRRKAIILGTAFCCIGVALQTASINSKDLAHGNHDRYLFNLLVGMFLAGRFIIGVGM